jgi:hypothetical protein
MQFLFNFQIHSIYIYSKNISLKSHKLYSLKNNLGPIFYFIVLTSNLSLQNNIPCS